MPGFLARPQYTPDCLRWSQLSTPSESGAPPSWRWCVVPVWEELKVPYFQSLAAKPSHPIPPSCPLCFSSAAVSYPGATGNAAIRRTMTPNSGRVRWASAGNLP